MTSFDEGIKLLCLGASYCVALASEVGAWLIPAKLRRTLSLCFAAAGVLAHTLYIAHRSIASNVCPIKSSAGSMIVLSWVLAVTYLSIRWYYPRVAVGIFALPLVVGLIAVAAFLGPDSRRELEGLARVWGPIHGAVVVTGAIAVFVGFVAGVMYLVQAYRLKRKYLPGDLLGLPSLESLERINRKGITVAFSLLTIGLGIGFLLALERRQAGDVSIRWIDPKVISAVVVWVVFGFLLQIRSQPQFRGRKVALLTIVGFGLLLFAIVGVDLLMPSSWHQAVSGGGV